MVFYVIKFAYQDFGEDGCFKNTNNTNIKIYEMLLGKFVGYCIENQVVNAEEINYSHVRQYLLNCHEKGDKAGTINTKLLRIQAFLNYLVECEVFDRLALSSTSASEGNRRT